MPKSFLPFFFLSLFVLITSAQAAIKENFHIQAKLEQANIPITKSFSIRAKSINQVRIKKTANIEVKEVYIELSDGTFIKLDVKKLKAGDNEKWPLVKKHIKTITFTALTTSKGDNQLEFILTR
ncbi:hypothetical protein [Halobacteriovorax marinus]|uniref:hypothetical protein n=1 Tax=Halobacteriovorax marinus TaxID=97084 RepID=UPI0002E258C5|nr:hypothetical protein [Halobacteriovorax marinus]